ncbi:MAG: hypothetical protein Q9209_007832 [Squamulea sp. 1 TL-2023]
MSNIRVSVEWDKTAVYAGEDVDCVITFKNVAQACSPDRTASQTSNHNSPGDQWKNDTAAHLRQQNPSRSPRYGSSTPVIKEHRKALSRDSAWSTIPASSKTKVGLDDDDDEQTPPRQRHRRSVSIVSIGGEHASSGKAFPTVLNSKQLGHGHSPAASLQILPWKHMTSDHGPDSTTQSKGSSVYTRGQTLNTDGSATIPALLRSATSPIINEKSSTRALRTSEKSANAPNSAYLHNRTAVPGDFSSMEYQESNSLGVPAEVSHDLSNDISDDRAALAHFPRPDPPLGKLPGIISPTSINGTPRTSAERNSFSSNSSDTMASEYMMQEHGRFLHHPATARQQSSLTRTKASQLPETLMMGYGNIVGSFNLDASLVDTRCFDEVKRKAVVGNQGGGGVVRTKSTKPQSGLLGSLGWNAIGGSLEGLLGTREMSSIKETTNTSTAKWMPILSTPQSLLFVDLRLEPGQSQSYSYSFRLPAGLPPSHRGKAVRFSYNIVIGVQKAAPSRQKHIVRQVDFPFRVFPSVNGTE